MLRSPAVKKDTENEGQDYAKNSKPQFERAKNLVDPAIQEMLKYNKSPESLRVLDVGCGAGDIANYLASTYKVQVDGLDIASEMIEAAQEKYGNSKNLKFTVADAAEFSFNSKKFDLIISTSTLQWVSDDKIQQAFTTISQHLKRGGRLLFLVPTYDFPHIVIKNHVAFSDKWKEAFKDYVESQSFRTAESYQAMLEKANLNGITIEQKTSLHECTVDGFIGFTKQWCGCFNYL